MKKHAVLAVIGLLLPLVIMGCNTTPAPRATTQSNPEARPANRENQPQATARYDAREDRSGSRRSRRGRPEEQRTPGQFDFYLFNLSWSPEFCATHGDSPECGRKLGFVVHGLWPQDASGDYPQHCSSAPRTNQSSGRY
jgi:ribonuclease I